MMLNRAMIKKKYAGQGQTPRLTATAAAKTCGMPLTSFLRRAEGIAAEE